MWQKKPSQFHTEYVKLKKNNFLLSEKPKLKFRVNVGLYLIESKVLKIIKQKNILDFNSFLNTALKKNIKSITMKLETRTGSMLAKWIIIKTLLTKKNLNTHFK